LGLSWFIRVLIQWMVIAFFVCVPILFPSFWPESAIFCGIVVFGLLSYGLLNPAYIIRRAFVWGGITIIGSSLAPVGATTAVGNLLEAWDLHPKINAVLEFIAWLFLDSVNSWQAITVLCILGVVELARMAPEYLPAFLGGDLTKIAVSDSHGTISYLSDRRSLIINIPFSVSSNQSKNTLVTGARLAMFFFRNIETRLHEESDVNIYEITTEKPNIVQPNEPKSYMIVVQNSPRLLVLLVRVMIRLRLTYILDISGYFTVYGSYGLPSKPTRLTFSTRSVSENSHTDVATITTSGGTDDSER